MIISLDYSNHIYIFIERNISIPFGVARGCQLRLADPQLGPRPALGAGAAVARRRRLGPCVAGDVARPRGDRGLNGVGD